MHLFNLFWDKQAWNQHWCSSSLASSLQPSCHSFLNAEFSGTRHHTWPVCSFKSYRPTWVPCRPTLNHDSYCDRTEQYRCILLNVRLQAILNGRNWQSFQTRKNQRQQYWRKRISTVLKRRKMYYKTQNKICRTEKHLPLTNKQNPLIGRESRPFGIEDAPHRHGDSTANCPHKGNHENKIHKSPLARSYVPMHKIAKLPVLVFLLRLRVNYQVPVNVFTFQAPSVSQRMLHKYIHAGISPS